MIIYIGSDHAAFEAKEELISFLAANSSCEIKDLGPSSSSRCDYPDYAIKVAKAVQESEEKDLGILLCGSGVGMSMVANRFKGVRAALCRTASEAEVTKRHNNANILCLGGRVSSSEEIAEMTTTWLEAKFEGGRHKERVELFNNLGI